LRSTRPALLWRALARPAPIAKEPQWPTRFRLSILSDSLSASSATRAAVFACRSGSTESIGEIGSFNVGRRTVVVINSGELTATALTEHRDAFVPLGGAADCAWRLLANGAVIKEGRSDRARSRTGRRAFAAALHAQLDAAARFAAQLSTPGKVGDDINRAQETPRSTRRLGVWRRLDVKALHDIRKEIAAALAGHSSTSGDHAALDAPDVSAQASRDGRLSVRKLRQALARAAAASRTAHASRGQGALAPLSSSPAANTERDGGTELAIELTSALLLSVESMQVLIDTIWRRLAEHPDVRARLQRELDRVLKGRTPRHGDLHRLPFTLNVIRESLRLDPPVVMFSRRLARDIELGDYVVRAGSIVVFNTRRMQRCVSLFPCPDVFNPDRFDAVEGKVARTAVGDLASADPTRPAGDRYVWALTHLVLAAVAQRLSLVPRGASHTVSAVRSAVRTDATHAGVSGEQVEPRGRRWWHPLAGAWPVAPPAVRHRTAGRGQTLTGNSAVDGGSNLILTCEALRAAW
jgi:cytochrome P450